MVIKVIKKTARKPVKYEYERDPERVLAELRSFKARSEQLCDMRSELLEKYPDQHAALTENGTLVVAPTIPEVVAKIKEIGERPGFAARTRLNTKPLPHRIPS